MGAGGKADEGEAEKHSGVELFLETNFETLGRSVARMPLVYIAVSLVITVIASSGRIWLEAESRADKQWVPDGAQALLDADYVSETWPSEQRFNLWIATCPDIDGEPDPNCNMLTADRMQALFDVHNQIMDVVIDGDAIVEEQKKNYPNEEAEIEERYGGQWTFEGGQNMDLGGVAVTRTWMATPPTGHSCDAANDAGAGGCCMESLYRTCDCSETAATCVSDDPLPEYESTCFKFGPFCAQQNILDVFAPTVAMFAPTAAYADHVANLTDPMVLEDVNSWNNVHLQKHGCYDMDGTIQTDDMLAAGEQAHAHHCVCDEDTAHDGNLADGTPVVGFCTPETCEAGVGSQESDVASAFKKRVWMAGCNSCNCDSWDAAHPEAQTAESPFNADRFEIAKVAGGLTGTPGAYTSAKALFGFYAVSKNMMFTRKDGRTMDPVNDEWEKQALCRMGIAGPKKGGGGGEGAGPGTGNGDGSGSGCQGHPLLSFKAMFSRSFGDAFGDAIRGDLAALITAYYLMAGYLFVMLSRYDTVHSMIGMSCVALAICGMSFMSCVGMGGYIGIYDNNLNSNIPFLLLGLGIDDAFVLTSEFTRATTMLGSDASMEDRTAAAMKGGAISILITSATDALAFLIGSSTVMPALRWFCLFAGMGIIFCFVFQIICYVPFLVLNAKRAEAGYLDCLCCVKSSAGPRDINEPKGCCSLCCKEGCGVPLCGEYKVDKLSRFLSGTWVPFITSQVGMGVTGVVFSALLILSLLGCAWIPVDFKIEWFIPSDSYVNEFYELNSLYFDTGTGMNVYTKEGDYFARQDELIALNNYVRTTEYIDHTQAVTDWYQTFTSYVGTTDNAAAEPDFTWSGGYDAASKKFTDKATFYTALSSFYSGADGTRFRSSMSWVDKTCEDRETWDGCNWEAGLAATRMDATIQASKLTGGQDRYDAMTAMRKEIGEAMDGAFPYAREFTNWEEVGVIGTELLRNLVVCGLVIIAVVFTMIPDPKVSGWVILCILLSIVDVLGMLYWWDITINSITTIYVLISVGLAVDYAAHIAHMFKEAKGTAQERACEALGRIGPCVLNAMISTFLAVLMLSFSKSYVFVTMFRAFCLVVIIAGGHGMWLLPVLLTLFAGDNGVADDDSSGGKGSDADTEENPAGAKGGDDDEEATD